VLKAAREARWLGNARSAQRAKRGGCGGRAGRRQPAPKAVCPRAAEARRSRVERSDIGEADAEGALEV
jgi:hypothetical protein